MLKVHLLCTFYLYKTCGGKDLLTCFHILQEFLGAFWCVLVGALKILKDVDVWGKVDHVLFPTAVRHTDERP